MKANTRWKWVTDPKRSEWTGDYWDAFDHREKEKEEIDFEEFIKRLKKGNTKGNWKEWTEKGLEEKSEDEEEKPYKQKKVEDY